MTSKQSAAVLLLLGRCKNNAMIAQNPGETFTWWISKNGKVLNRSTHTNHAGRQSCLVRFSPVYAVKHGNHGVEVIGSHCCSELCQVRAVAQFLVHVCARPLLEKKNKIVEKRSLRCKSQSACRAIAVHLQRLRIKECTWIEGPTVSASASAELNKRWNMDLV